ncbi:MAG: DUF6350 family protein [Terrimesophilobacter sp.]
MNRPITALFAALEALLVVGIGIGIPLVPLTFLWAFQYGLQIDWTVFWRASVDVWLVGHGADVTLTLDPVTASVVGFPGAGAPFVFSIAALGVALLTALLAVRTGRRIAETPYVRLGTIVALLVFAALSAGATVSAVHRFARPSLWQGALFPTLVFTAGLIIGIGIATRRLDRMPGRNRTSNPLRDWWDSRPEHRRAVVTQSLRGGMAAVAAVMTVSGILLAVMILLNYSRVIALYESVHSGVLGGIAVTLGELAFLPNLVVWAAAWLIGPGFAIGAGSSVGPLGTSLGPLPAIPIFGALPVGDLALGFLGLLVPVVAGFLVGVLVRPAVLRATGERSPATMLVLTGLGIGIVGGVLLAILAGMSAGAAGPGRLGSVGPDALQVGLWAVLEIGLPAILGLLAGRPARSK